MEEELHIAILLKSVHSLWAEVQLAPAKVQQLLGHGVVRPDQLSSFGFGGGAWGGMFLLLCKGKGACNTCNFSSKDSIKKRLQ
jgi:hypothetical protein